MAGEVLDGSVLLARFVPLRLWHSLPGYLLGAGILGTFVGLVMGLAGFKTGTSKELETSIGTLLTGVNAAFVTSIWGMSLSIVVGVVERWQVGCLDRAAGFWVIQLDQALPRL
jgi:hypothetical protein